METIDKDKVKALFDNNSRMSDINAVMSSAEDELTIRQNQYRDFITRKSLLKYLKATRTDNLLDFGCGIGRLARCVARKVNSVVGVDVSSGMIEKAKKESLLPNIEYNLLTTNYDFGKERFSKIYTCWVLQHISGGEIKSYLENFYKWLKPNGRMVILEQVRLNQSRQSEYMIQRMEDDYKKLFESAGFKFVESHKVFRVPSYAMDIWKRYKLPRVFLPLLGIIEKYSIMRKPEYIDYVSSVMVFKK